MCPGPWAEGTAGGLYTPGGFENTEKKNQCRTGNGRFPAALAWSPQGQQREEQSLCSPCSGRRRNSILPFSPQLRLTATALPRRSTQFHYIYLHSSSIRHNLFDIFETLTPFNPSYPCAIHSTTNDNEATAAQHWARSHRRATSSKKPLPPRIGHEATTAPSPTRSHIRPSHPCLSRSSFVSPHPLISLSFYFSF